ncbi:MAG: thermonuclease family protein [Cyclobacteriaceae bacterium]|nr:thermonuclease family protein [Cyclobacteriaceae bacterium]
MIYTTIITGCLICSLVLVKTEEQVRVVDVIDGNTVEVKDAGGEQYTVMLNGVDAPEIGQDFGEEARKYLEKKVKGKKVRMEQRGKDRKGRWMVDIYMANDRSLNTMMVEEGMAWVGKGVDEGMELMEKAREERKGLWALENPEPPWIYRRKVVMKEPKSR